MPKGPPRVSLDRALARLKRLEGRLPEDVRGEFEKASAQLRAAIDAARAEQQAMADRVSAHEAMIEELQRRVDEVGQANANQARLLGALTQAEAGGPVVSPIIQPTGRPLPTIEPSVSPSPRPSPTAAPSATPLAIASAFQQAFSAMQTGVGEPGPTIRSMDVQVKGLVQVANDGSATTLTFPTPDNPLSGDVLSTVSMSLGAVPGLTPSPAPSPPPG